MSYRVLVVDDSAVVRSVLRKALLRSGEDISQVLEARDGQEALELLNKEWVDIVFTDLNMPRMGGVELVERMHSDPALSTVPIIVITSVRSDILQRELMEKGVKKYIRKPFRPEQLAKLLKEILTEEWR